MNQPDFIVVGAGSAGCVLTRRLAEEFNATVTLVEAPSSPAPTGDRQRPAHWIKLLKSVEDWDFPTEPTPSLAKRRLQWPRGRGIGGSSRINAMIWFPPTSSDLNRLAHASGNHWNADRVLTALKSVESLLQPEEPRWLSEPSRRFLHAAQSLKDAKPMVYQRLNRRGQRTSLQSLIGQNQDKARSWENRIQVVRGTADRLIWTNEKVNGVELLTENGRAELVSRYGVILASGAIGTPTLLMRSGIGCRNALKEHGIAPRIEHLSVGENLRDHLIMPVIFQRTSDADRFSPFGDPRHLVQWQTLGSGPLSSNLAECGGLFLNDAIQIHVTPTHYLTFPKEDSSAWMTIGANVTQPQSCGRLQLRSADPSEPPVITTNYLDQQQDLERSIQGVEYVRELANSDVFRDVISAELVPGAKRITREAIARSIERYSQTLYHPIGTCAAGNHPEDAVDHRFRLRNSSGLWVVDGSVFPGITVGNPNATIMSLAWMAAEEIAASR